MRLEQETIAALQQLDAELALLIAVTNDPPARQMLLERVRDNARYAVEKLRALRTVRSG